MTARPGLSELAPVIADAGHPRGEPPWTLLRPQASRWARYAGLYLVLAAGSVVMIYPFLWMLATSLRSLPDVALAGASVIPQHWLWSNYAQALDSFPFWEYLANSLITTVIPIVAVVFTSSLAGFAFARMRVRGSSALFVIVLATMLLPGEVTLVPQYILFRQLGMINTLYPLVIPSLFGAPITGGPSGAFFIFLFRQFYRRVPESLVDAAVIDGCGWFRMWWRVFTPLARPVAMASSVLLFMGYWNNFLGPTIYINSDRWKTLPMALAGFQSVNSTDTPGLMATTTVMILPCIILFFFAQRAFLEGVTFTGAGGQ
jgi:multiple sugar transport system permease protein